VTSTRASSGFGLSCVFILATRSERAASSLVLRTGCDNSLSGVLAENAVVQINPDLDCLQAYYMSTLSRTDNLICSL
jgi:hypothetical protein